MASSVKYIPGIHINRYFGVGGFVFRERICESVDIDPADSRVLLYSNPFSAGPTETACSGGKPFEFGSKPMSESVGPDPVNSGVRLYSDLD